MLSIYEPDLSKIMNKFCTCLSLDLQSKNIIHKIVLAYCQLFFIAAINFFKGWALKDRHKSINNFLVPLPTSFFLFVTIQPHLFYGLLIILVFSYTKGGLKVRGMGGGGFERCYYYYNDS